MKRSATDTFEVTAVGGEAVRAFIPAPLPPQPALDLSGPAQPLLERALLALGRLDSISALLPDTDLFLYGYVRKEAVLSSQIEGTQSSLSDLLLFEMEQAPGAPLDDVVEVSGYVRALGHGLARLRAGFPLSSCLIREVHAELLARGRGSDKHPGAFRRSQNWIGGARPGNAVFVPPPNVAVAGCISDLERFLHDDRDDLAVLIKAALAHLQFGHQDGAGVRVR
jgi:Fic family protein